MTEAKKTTSIKKWFSWKEFVKYGVLWLLLYIIGSCVFGFIGREIERQRQQRELMNQILEKFGDKLTLDDLPPMTGGVTLSNLG